MNPVTILVVDDSPTVRMTTRRALEACSEYKAVVLEAGSGVEALQKFEIQRPDIVLLDVEMPDMGGIEVVKKFREMEGHEEFRLTPVIFITALNGEKTAEKCLEAGGDDFITKPVSPIVLRAKIKAFKRTIDLRQRLEASLVQASLASLHDHLTGVGNRRAFDSAISNEWNRAARDNKDFSVIALDIDFFKRYNDTYGHQAGDNVLTKVAGIIGDRIQRAGDGVFRVGGEEFYITLPGSCQKGAAKVAEDIRLLIEAADITHGGGNNGKLTISMGVSTGKIGEEEPSDMIKRADDLMYAAKAHGRGIVVCEAA